jgi:enoyl-CoA hydratase/carnithine racemase
MIQHIEHGEVHELRLDRPPVNALSTELFRALTAELGAAPERGARALVISGREGMFSAGLDVPQLLALDRPQLELAVATFFDALIALAESPVPVVAAITGHSPAGGAVLALCCDRRVMAEGPFGIGLNEVRIGIAMPEIVALLLRRAVGPRLAEELCVTGRLLQPAEALAIGLVDEVAPDPVAAARAWCGHILQAPAQALAETRRRLRRDLVDLVRGQRDHDVRSLAEAWFEPELQLSLRELVTRLKAK